MKKELQALLLGLSILCIIIIGFGFLCTSVAYIMNTTGECVAVIMATFAALIALGYAIGKTLLHE